MLIGGTEAAAGSAVAFIQNDAGRPAPLFRGGRTRLSRKKPPVGR
jgi:hypothetical protein